MVRIPPGNRFVISIIQMFCVPVDVGGEGEHRPSCDQAGELCALVAVREVLDRAAVQIVQEQVVFSALRRTWSGRN